MNILFTKIKTGRNKVTFNTSDVIISSNPVELFLHPVYLFIAMNAPCIPVYGYVYTLYTCLMSMAMAEPCLPVYGYGCDGKGGYEYRNWVDTREEPAEEGSRTKSPPTRYSETH